MLFIKIGSMENGSVRLSEVQYLGCIQAKGGAGKEGGEDVTNRASGTQV